MKFFKKMNKKYTPRIPRNRGVAVITAVIFFVIISVAVAVGLSTPVVSEYKTARDFEKSKGAYYLSEAGSEDALYRIKKGKTIDTQEILSLGGNIATTTITDVNPTEKFIESIGDILTNTRRVKSTLTTTSGSSFSYGVQAGDGGVVMQNNALINGNLFSNGPVVGESNWILGTVVSASTTIGSISGIKSTGSMYAPTIANSIIGGPAYCDTITGSVPNFCSGASTLVPGSLPFTQEQIAQWEADAAAGGVITCTNNTYVISGTMSLGPVKIVGTGGAACDLRMEANADVTLLGPVWVVGDILLKSSQSLSSAKMTVSPTLYGKSVMLIADNPADRINSSTVTIEKNVSFNGAGSGSYIELLGQNIGASLVPPQSTNAVEVEGSVNGALLVYAGLGNISIKDQAALKQVSGYKISLSGVAIITYDVGLSSVVFASGPGGSWVISDWKEGQ